MFKYTYVLIQQQYNACTVRVENFEVFLISRFSWVADDTKIIHVKKVELIPAKFSK